MEGLVSRQILIVDDTEENLDILVETLGSLYDIRVALDGETALELIRSNRPDLILLDILMPGMDGYQVCSILKSDPETKEIPIIFITAMDQIEAKTKGFEIGAVDYITKPFEVLEVQARVRTHILLKVTQESLQQQNRILDTMVRERTQELLFTRDVTIQSLSSLAETRDNDTGGHIQRTRNYVLALARKLQSNPSFSSFLNEETIDLLGKSAPLHDIGKVGVPDSILMKPGKLTKEEFNEMKKHTVLGFEALQKAAGTQNSSSFLRHAREFAYTHHERWDGTGYPRGLADSQIPLEGRLMAVADVYDALICKRVYKQPFPHSKAVSIIKAEAGFQFDPQIVKAFIDIHEEFRTIGLRYADYEEEREALMQ